MSESEIERINKISMDRLTEKLRRRVDHMINMEASHTKTLEWEAADAITALRAKVERLEGALRNAYEVYAGSDGIIPETAAEGYQQQIIKQMVDCISAALGDTHE